MWQTRAIEITSGDLWSWAKVLRVVDYAREHHFNALILGQPDLLNCLAAPDDFKIKTYDDRESNIQRFNGNYLNKISRYCARYGIDLYLQCKELSIASELLLSHREMIDGGGKIKPDIDFWCLYLQEKLSLAMAQLPGLKGIFLAISNTDSLVRFAAPSGAELNISHEMSPCAFDGEAFYRRLYSTAEKVMRQYQKQFAIRLFPASHDDVATLIASISGLPADVDVSVKITPERFWPEFPNNPALLDIHGRDIWVEFDFCGEEVGWGNIPFIRYEEIQGRILWCRENNPQVKNIICRITWDGIYNACVLDSLSEFTLYACAQEFEGKRPAAQQTLFRSWLMQRFAWPCDAAQANTILECCELARQVICHTIYVKQHVFHRHSMLPVSYGQAVWSLYGQLNRNHWLPGSGKNITFDPQQTAHSSDNLYRISLENDQALKQAETCYQMAMNLARSCDFPPALHSLWMQEWSGFPLYCRMFVCAQKAFFTLHYCHRVENGWALREIARANIQALYGVSRELSTFSATHADYPVSYDHRLDADKAFRLAQSLETELTALEGDR